MSLHRSTATRRWAPAGLLAAAVSVLVGCSGGSAEPPGAALSGRLLGPRVDPCPGDLPDGPRAADECRDYASQAVRRPSNEDPVVGCRAPYTAWTYFVGTIPRKVLTGAAATEDDSVSRYARTACDARFLEAVGADLRQARISVLRPTTFVPTLRQRQAGAGWFRYDVNAQPEHALLWLPAGAGPSSRARTSTTAPPGAWAAPGWMRPAARRSPIVPGPDARLLRCRHAGPARA